MSYAYSNVAELYNIHTYFPSMAANPRYDIYDIRVVGIIIHFSAVSLHILPLKQR